MKEIIENYEKAQLKFDEQQRPVIVEAIKKELSKIGPEEKIPVSSPNCDGFGIATGTYADAFNYVDKEGGTIVYNNNECQGSLAYGAGEDSIFDMSLDVLIEVLKCCTQYNNDKIMSESEIKDLKVILDSLDGGSDLRNSLSKAIKLLS